MQQLEAEVKLLPLDSIRPSKNNPRQVIHADEMTELAKSIEQQGLLNPIVVRPVPAKGKTEGHWEIIAGERRFRAHQFLKRTHILASVRQATDEEAAEMQTVENLQREDLHPLEEAKGFQRLIELRKCDVRQLAERLGRSDQYVYDSLGMLKLIPAAKELFLANRFTRAHAILVSRQRADVQKKLVAGNDAAMFRHEQGLFDPFAKDEKGVKLSGMAPRSLREVRQWIDEHVKLDTKQLEPMLFPDAVAALEQHGEAPIPVTFDHYVQPSARDGKRVFGPRSFKPADGNLGKHCDYSKPGIVVVGPGRGRPLRVCTAKDECKVHWAYEIKQAAERKKAGDKAVKKGRDRAAAEHERWERQQAQEKLHEEAWAKYLPAILDAVAEAVKRAPTGARGLLATIITGEVCRLSGKLGDRVPLGKTTEELVRHLAFVILAGEANRYRAYQNFPRRARAFGIDVRRLTKAVDEKEAARVKA